MTAEEILTRMRFSWRYIYNTDRCTDIEYYHALGDMAWLANFHDLPDLVEMIETDLEENFE